MYTEKKTTSSQLPWKQSHWLFQKVEVKSLHASLRELFEKLENHFIFQCIYLQSIYRPHINNCWQIVDKMVSEKSNRGFWVFWSLRNLILEKYQVLGQHSLQLFLLWQNCNAIVPSATPGRWPQTNSENHLKSWFISTQKWSHVSYSLWIQSPYQRMIGVYKSPPQSGI